MLTQRLSLTNQDARKLSSTRLHQIGSIAETADGRVYRYSRAAAVALDAGKLNINADLIANHTNCAVAAAVAVGATEVTATLGATAATLDQYRDGLLVVNDATGEGINYLINGNMAADSAGTIRVTLDEPIAVALTTSSEVTLKYNTYDNVIISIADQADQPVGVNNIAVTASYYCWLQTRGECAVLADEAVTKGAILTIGSSTVGAVEAVDAVAEPVVGVASEALVDTEYRSAFLMMD
jgi:hypothetical protein